MLVCVVFMLYFGMPYMIFHSMQELENMNVWPWAKPPNFSSPSSLYHLSVSEICDRCNPHIACFCREE